MHELQCLAMKDMHMSRLPQNVNLAGLSCQLQSAHPELIACSIELIEATIPGTPHNSTVIVGIRVAGSHQEPACITMNDDLWF